MVSSSRLLLLTLALGLQCSRIAGAQDEQQAGQLAPQPGKGREDTSDELATTDDAGPEMSASGGVGVAASGADEVIADPELQGVAPGRPQDRPVEPFTPTGHVRLRLRSRVATDVKWEDPREEVWEATQIALLEAKLRRTEHLRFAAGIRMRHHFASLKEDTVDAEAERFELDAVPTAGYADVTLLDGLHLRAGYQIVHLGRFDVFSASNFLDALDLRNGPTTMPEAGQFAQLAVRIDWDPLTWLSLRAVYLPFFQPHLFTLFDSDYALFPAEQAQYESAYEGIIAEVDEPMDSAPMVRLLKLHMPRSVRSGFAESGFSAFAPEPSLVHPQGAVCITAHGSTGEIGMTAGTALERLPAIYLSDEVFDALRTGSSDARQPLDPDEPLPLEVMYNRFAVFALDGATDIGPVQLGAEVAYILDRTFYAVKVDSWPWPEYTDLLHVGLRGEYIRSTEWILALEGFFAYSLYVPYEPDREWLFLEQGRYLRGAAAHISWSPSDIGWTFEAGGAVFSGPSYFVSPRVEVRLISEFYAEVGAYLVGGPSATTFGSADIALGGLYDHIDQVFVGLRWLP